MVGITYLGPEGTFTEAALLQMMSAGLIPDHHLGPVERTPIESTPAALEAVRSGETDYACVPIENSIDGTVVPTLDSLANGSPMQIFAETTLDVAFSIVVQPGLGKKLGADDVKTLAAFPVAAAQVRRWLAANLPDVELRPAYSNADAARQVAKGEADAAVTSPLAATHWKLESLAQGVVDELNARTRFVLVGRPGPPPVRTGADRTSVVLRIENAPGALLAALGEFGIRDIDLTRIESRPTRTELGTYQFFVDCAGHIDDDAVAEALKALHRRCVDVRYLGSWPTGSATGIGPPPPDEASRWLARLREGKPEQADASAGGFRR
ncbi:MAG: prephenate dehydratase [Actinomycetota bacterium]|uniref:Prephenate dehydratase n=1 Tax=Mycobacterium lentiflavum TaxID=141349 RepID=A0ABY3V400_MYCLN|nr:prephenate dehydratase [Mycobacterium lentiflavum]MEE3063646.1 prephenate dehydratase [Actinomycetota bacterium]ULP45362.1 prephenate dehydratase [Mycobacterium lentiflavum]